MESGPPPPPPIFAPVQNKSTLNTLKETGTWLSTRTVPPMVVTVEDLQKVKLKRTPFNLFVSITHKYADIKTFQLQTFNSVLLRVK